MLFERSNFTLLCLRDTPVAVIGRQASEQHRLSSLFPEEPCPGQVVEQATHSDNFGAYRLSYYGWKDQIVDITQRGTSTCFPEESVEARIARCCSESSSLIFLLICVRVLSFLPSDVFTQGPDDLTIERATVLTGQQAHLLKHFSGVTCPIGNFFLFLHANNILMFCSQCQEASRAFSKRRLLDGG